MAMSKRDRVTYKNNDFGLYLIAVNSTKTTKFCLYPGKLSLKSISFKIYD